MKSWWIAGIIMFVAMARALAAPAPDVQIIKDNDGTVLGMTVVCSECQSGAGTSKAACTGGAETGWVDGKPCGKCLLSANANARWQSRHSMHFTGKLVDQSGQPAKDRFVKLFLTNGWSVRSKTGDDGTYRLMVGPTVQPKAKKPLRVDLGARVDSGKSRDYFAIYLLPESYNPCAASEGPPASVEKRNGKKP